MKENSHLKPLMIILITYAVLLASIVFFTIRMYPDSHLEKQKILIKNEQTDVSKPE